MPIAAVFILECGEICQVRLVAVTDITFPGQVDGVCAVEPEGSGQTDYQCNFFHKIYGWFV